MDGVVQGAAPQLGEGGGGFLHRSPDGSPLQRELRLGNLFPWSLVTALSPSFHRLIAILSLSKRCLVAVMLQFPTKQLDNKWKMNSRVQTSSVVAKN